MISLFQYYRIVAAFLILLMHQQFWQTGPFMAGLKNAAVPLFACMAGYLYKKGLSPKVTRIIVPYLFWAVIYFVANNVLFDVVVKREPLVIPELKAWLLGGTACHLWFLPCLFVAYAVTSALSNIKRQTSSLMLLLVAIATQFLPGETSASLLGYCKIYLGRLLVYFSIGLLLQSLLNSSRGSAGSRSNTLQIVIGGGGLVMLGLSNLWGNLFSGLVLQPLPLVVGCVLLAVGVGEFKLPKLVERVASATMGIYLVHVLLTSVANAVLAKCGHPQLPMVLGLPLAVALFVLSYWCSLALPKWLKG